MLPGPKLFLYSLAVTPRQCGELTKLAGKEPGEIKIALIENAADPIPNSHEWLGGFREMLSANGYRVEVIDLHKWIMCRSELNQKLQSKDVICLGGGHTYYLRWILKETGTDLMIRELVHAGKVYAGWSAGAIMAGPTTEFFNIMGDNPADAPEYIPEGLRLTDVVIVPHVDNPDFNNAAIVTNRYLQKAGYTTCTLKDDEVFITNGAKQWVL